MPQDFKHLTITKEQRVNPRRTRQFAIPSINRSDLRGHGHKLATQLTETVQALKSQATSDESRFILRLSYSGQFDFSKLIRHGIELISQEEKEVCIVFATEAGLAQFADHLAKLGLADQHLSYKNILEAIEGVGAWSREDRLSWAIKKYGLPISETFHLDVEFWPIHTARHPERVKLIDGINTWLSANNISIIDSLNLDSLLMYRVELNKDSAELLLNHQDVRFVDTKPRSGINYQKLNLDIDTVPSEIAHPAEESARVCILDSGINSAHPLLRSCIAERESFIDGTGPEDETGHGTAVAGIAAFGDLEQCLSSNYWKPEFWIFSGKVLYRDEVTGHPSFDTNSIESTIERAVTYFAAERDCKIFNLSIGNADAPYDGKHVRGLAYTLDVLARKYDVLFIVSTGNFTGSEDPAIPANSWRSEYPDYLMAAESAIIDPAPALNALTVGSLARHDATVDELRYPEINALCPAKADQPSPFTRHGPSVRGALKPELVATGGNLASPMRQNRQWSSAMKGLGVLTLNHDFVSKTLLAEISGTSFAAPYITHLAARLLNEYPNASANLLRAMLVNHADLPDAVIEAFPHEWKEEYRKRNGWRELPREIAGYGKIETDILFRSTESAVALLAEDSIGNNCHQFYELPFPADFLRKQRALRRVRVSLAYSPPVRTTRLDYVATKIFFRLVKGRSLEEVQLHFNHNTQADHEAIADAVCGDRRAISTQIRDKGTTQSSIWTFKQMSPSEKWFVVVTRQDRDWGEALCSEHENYALVVSATDQENEEAKLYSQMQALLQQREQSRARL